MVQLNKKLIILFTAIILIAGWSGWWLLHDVMLLTNIGLYPAIPAFFFVLGISTITILTHINRNNGRKVVNVYMILKLIKFILAAIAVLVLFLVVGENKKTLLLTFAAYYFIYIICEVYIYSQVEKTDKALRKNE
jgi:glucan phosphoethanolaminetransferase (alkaline phosphatase superfamily)